MEIGCSHALENLAVKVGVFYFAVLNSHWRKMEVKVENPFTGTFPTKSCYVCWYWLLCIPLWKKCRVIVPPM